MRSPDQAQERDRHADRGREQRSEHNNRGFAVPYQQQRMNREPHVAPNAPPAVGSVHQGIIKTIRPFGCFVDIGYPRDVLVHHSALSEEIKLDRSDDDESKVKAMEFFFPRGTKVYVKILEEQQGGKISGSIRGLDQDTGQDLQLEPENTRDRNQQLQDDPPAEGSVLRATVKRIEAYGIFVQLEGFRRQGLVHSSQVSNYLSVSRDDPDEVKKAELAGVVSIGEQIYVKVVEVDDDGSGRGVKIGCSLKVVDQTTGEDLDPTGLRYKPRRDAGGGRGTAQALGATAGEVGRGGKIDWGYLEGEKKLYVGDHEGKYKLLDEENPVPLRREPYPPPLPREEEVLPPPPPGPQTVEEALAIIEAFNRKKQEDRKDKKKKKKDKRDKKKKSKSKKEKRHKSERKRDESSSSSGSDDPDDQLLEK